jgi:hypothetical protein
MSLTDRIREVRAMFPEDSVVVSRFFGAALNAEDSGDGEKAVEYLDKAIQAEREGR